MSSKRKLIEGWIDKAGNHLQSGRSYLKSPHLVSESVQASQESVELSVKSILAFLNVEYPPSHGWDRDQFSKIARQVRDKHIIERLRVQNLDYTVRVPRLLLFANFWAQFYLPAKYGFGAGYLAPPQDLFEKQEAELAVQHAEECWRAASHLRYLTSEQLDAIADGSIP